MNTRYFETSIEWEDWLAINHETESELCLIYYKKDSGKSGISYEDSVKAALCYGWIDGLVKKLDDERYTRRFTPRKKNSIWSESNKKRVQELIEAGKMRPAGMRLVDAAKVNGNWEKVIVQTGIELNVPADFAETLRNFPNAKAVFERLPNSHKKEFLVWIQMAKRDETRERRIKKSVEMLLEREKPGLK